MTAMTVYDSSHTSNHVGLLSDMMLVLSDCRTVGLVGLSKTVGLSALLLLRSRVYAQNKVKKSQKVRHPDLSTGRDQVT